MKRVFLKDMPCLKERAKTGHIGDKQKREHHLSFCDKTTAVR
jgi:hypothetical protein